VHFQLIVLVKIGSQLKGACIVITNHSFQTSGSDKAMLELKAVAYASQATRPMRGRDLEFLLIDARAFNETLQVTGALLHHDGEFFQYLEGPSSSVDRVYQRIRQSGKHHGLRELLNQPVSARQFVRWHMAFTDAPLTTLQALTNEIWAMKLPTLNQAQALSPGLQLLMNFWESMQRVNATD